MSKPHRENICSKEKLEIENAMSKTEASKSLAPLKLSSYACDSGLSSDSCVGRSDHTNEHTHSGKTDIQKNLTANSVSSNFTHRQCNGSLCLLYEDPDSIVDDSTFVRDAEEVDISTLKHSNLAFCQSESGLEDSANLSLKSPNADPRRGCERSEAQVKSNQQCACDQKCCQKRTDAQEFSVDGHALAHMATSVDNNVPAVFVGSCPVQEGISGGDQKEECSENQPRLCVPDIPNDGFFSWVPHEIILKILSWLRPQELGRHVAPVCRRWRQVYKDPILWQTLELDDISSVLLCRIVRDCPLLRKLVIRGRSHFTVAEAMVITDFCVNLEELDIGFSRCVDVHRLQPFAEKCPKLRCVNVEGCSQVDGAAIQVLATAPSLQCLNFSHCVKLIDDDIIHLAENLPKITELNTDGIEWITDVSVINLVALHSRHLTHLTLDGEELTDTSLCAIGRQCSSLSKLSISFCQAFNDHSLVTLQRLNNLRQLCLRKGEYFSSQAVCELFTGSPLSGLTHLNISDCTSIDDSAILAVVQCCGKSLKELLLDWCWNITDTGLTSIIDHCCNLERLSVVGVKDLRGHALDRIPEDLPRLTFLDLQQVNMIDDTLLVDLVRRKANLQIVNYYGEKIIHT